MKDILNNLIRELVVAANQYKFTYELLPRASFVNKYLTKVAKDGINRYFTEWKVNKIAFNKGGTATVSSSLFRDGLFLFGSF